MIGPRTRFDEIMYCVGESATLLKEIDARETDALDQLPFPQAVRGPWCADYGKRTREDADQLDEQYAESLSSIGMQRREDGRMRITAPMAPCSHQPWTRNLSRDQLTCDGCRGRR